MESWARDMSRLLLDHTSGMKTYLSLRKRLTEQSRAQLDKAMLDGTLTMAEKRAAQREAVWDSIIAERSSTNGEEKDA